MSTHWRRFLCAIGWHGPLHYSHSRGKTDLYVCEWCNNFEAGIEP